MNLPRKGGVMVRLPWWLRLGSRGRTSTGREKRQARQRWLVMLLIGFFITVIEIIDHYEMDGAQGSGLLLLQDAELIREIIMFGIFVPIIGGLLLTLINRAGADRDMAVEELQQQRSFAEELSDATHWEDLVERILRFPGTIAPATVSFLKIIDKDEQVGQPTAAWRLNGAATPKQLPEYPLDQCRSCLVEINEETATAIRCPAANGTPENASTTRYCLQLATGQELIGALNFELPKDMPLAEQQQRMLADAAPGIALAIENARLQRLAANQSNAAAAERQRIAQDLHDSLAQNIGYLRFKLDQLSGDESLADIVDIQHDIEHMRDAATEAYERIRGTLETLDPNCQSDLTEALLERARLVGERSGFVVVVASRTDPFSLIPEVRRQVLFICQEALNNVEKHADARVVMIRIARDQQYITLSIDDDGSGFDPGKAPREGHLGLAIMHDRAQSIGGELTIESSVDSGTRVSLRLLGTTILKRRPMLRTAAVEQVNEGH